MLTVLLFQASKLKSQIFISLQEQEARIEARKQKEAENKETD